MAKINAIDTSDDNKVKFLKQVIFLTHSIVKTGFHFDGQRSAMSYNKN